MVSHVLVKVSGIGQGSSVFFSPSANLTVRISALTGCPHLCACGGERSRYRATSEKEIPEHNREEGSGRKPGVPLSCHEEV